ncbi:SGNH/GDSL hydrolase family protein [Flammeovirga pacifica]|nr:SGNH/GDSL hydrolase family protein [Flammeovirga pacifica]
MDKVIIEGRHVSKQNSLDLFWPGSSITFKVKTKSLQLKMCDTVGESEYLVIVDQEAKHQFVVNQDSIYTLWEENEVREVEITLHRLNDFSRGTTSIELSQFNGDFLPINKKKKQITYYGNSITVGYANVDTTGTDNSLYTSNYKAFSSLTSRALSASQNVIAKSGIGITMSWGDYIMPQIYNRIDPTDSTSVWDFQQDTTDLVVVNLMQNDYWLSGHPAHERYIHWIGRQQLRKEDFIQSYASFLKQLRKAHPQAPIICVLGCMDVVKEDSPFIDYVDEAVKELDDKSIYRLNFPYLAKEAHPNVDMHQAMSDILVQYIREHQLL